MLAGYFAAGRLGPNPSEYLIHTTGMLALVFLMLSLAVTPLRRITGNNSFSLFRRMLGLYAFFYTALHLWMYVWLDRAWDVASIAGDLALRPVIIFGMAGFLLMAPLAATSTARMVQRLGAKRWKRLHRLAYAAGAAGVVHYYLIAKVNAPKPLVFLGVLAVLLGFRAVAAVWQGRKRAADSGQGAPPSAARV
jgi:sulfoxide reductase heme-binding subunit YedZ